MINSCCQCNTLFNSVQVPLLIARRGHRYSTSLQGDRMDNAQLNHGIISTIEISEEYQSDRDHIALHSSSEIAQMIADSILDVYDFDPDQTEVLDFACGSGEGIILFYQEPMPERSVYIPKVRSRRLSRRNANQS